MLIFALSDKLYVLGCILIETRVCLSDLCAWIGKFFFPHPQYSSGAFQNAVALLYPVAPSATLCIQLLGYSVGFVGIFGYQMSFTSLLGTAL